MNMLRAGVRNKGDRWEVRLLDLAIAADGDSETSMLRDLEYALTAEYHLAVKYGRTPFRNIVVARHSEVSKSWTGGGVDLRALKIPAEVSQALASALGTENISQFRLQNCEAA